MVLFELNHVKYFGCFYLFDAHALKREKGVLEYINRLHGVLTEKGRVGVY